MEKLTHYRELVKQILTAHNQHKSAYGDLEEYTLFHEQDDRYLQWVKYQEILDPRISCF